MTASTRPRYWHRYVGPDNRWRRDPPPGADLAIFRSALGREAGSVPKLWPFYTCEVAESLAKQGRVSDEQAAEHAALALFGVHQQSQQHPMHRSEVSLGAALLKLRQSDKFSQQAVDRRVGALAAATSVPVLTKRVRGLIDQLRTIAQPLDYDHLLNDIRAWHQPARRDEVRRRWSLGYRMWTQPVENTDETASSQS